jgi:hypothetical protein
MELQVHSKQLYETCAGRYNYHTRFIHLKWLYDVLEELSIEYTCKFPKPVKNKPNEAQIKQFWYIEKNSHLLRNNSYRYVKYSPILPRRILASFFVPNNTHHGKIQWTITAGYPAGYPPLHSASGSGRGRATRKDIKGHAALWPWQR